MMDKQNRTLIAVFIILLMMSACVKTEDTPQIRTKIIDGIKHVYNSAEPANGIITLDVEKVLEVDPLELNPETPPLFSMAIKDNSEFIWLADNRNVRIYKLDPKGKLITEFLRQGQGPGEFPRFGDIQIVDDCIWVVGNWPMKIAKYTSDGQLVDEWRFRTFQNFYLRTIVVEENRFLTISYKTSTETNERTRMSALMNSDEEILTQYFEHPNAGIFRIRIEQQQGPAVASTHPVVAADIHHVFDRSSDTVYVCLNRKYEIHVKNIDGTARMIIHKDHQNITLDDKLKESVLQLIAPRIPMEVKQRAKDELPAALNAIREIEVLPLGYLAVKRFTGLETVEIDIFDGEGRFSYSIQASEELPDLSGLRFFKSTIGIIKQLSEKNVFLEYRVTNLPEIYRQ